VAPAAGGVAGSVGAGAVPALTRTPYLQTWPEMRQWLVELASRPPEGVPTVAIDTIDWMVQRIVEHVVVDLDGKSKTYPEMQVSVGVELGKFYLAQNYPNPFNPSTVIEFVVPKSGFVTMKVYNVLGQEVATLFEANAEAGKINTARFDASRLPSGVYFYTLKSAGKVETKQMVLMK
jgi:hypothetical protein